MHIAPQERRVREQRPDVVQFRLAVTVERVADRVLHPRVGGEDEQRREHRPERHQPYAGEVHALGKPAPAEQPQPEERRLQGERREALHRQRAAEHVADEARVGRPVHPELELLHQPGHDADRDVDQQQRPEEFRQALVLRLLVAIPRRLQERDEERQARSSRARTGSGRCSSSRTASERGRSSSAHPLALSLHLERASCSQLLSRSTAMLGRASARTSTDSGYVPPSRSGISPAQPATVPSRASGDPVSLHSRRVKLWIPDAPGHDAVGRCPRASSSG